MSIQFNYLTNAPADHEYFSNDYLLKKRQEFLNTVNDPDIGFFHLTEQFDLLDQVKQISEKFQSKKHFVQIGIGGSALGPQMLVSALQQDFDKSFTVLDNVDADYIHRELRKINLKESVFYIVSKSGGTAETLACYAIVLDELKQQAIEGDSLKEHLVFCTENKDSELMNHIKKFDYDFLEVPLNIGGRFSVLSPVGLLPAAFLGINIEELFQGANELKQNLLSEDVCTNNLLQTMAHTIYLHEQAQPCVDQTVLMPYSSILRDFSFWFVQLWAESLGKWSESKQQHVGLTPIPAYGATDQHSQVQLFMEGPNNKLIFLLKVEQTKSDYYLQNKLEIERAQMLGKYKLNQLLLAEFMGTSKALRENNRNVIEISINQISAKNLGSLILFFESLTAIVGRNFSIDPFNQPGVEKGKVYTFEYLKSM